MAKSKGYIDREELERGLEKQGVEVRDSGDKKTLAESISLLEKLIWDTAPKGMNRAIVILEWDGSMGPAWLNQSNLESLLYSGTQTNRQLLRVAGYIPPRPEQPGEDGG